MRNLCLFLSGCVLLGAAAAGQVSPPEQPAVPATPEQAATGPAATAAPAALPALLPQIEQQASNLRLDLARLRIDRWKTDSATRKQAQDNAASLDRNLAGALPILVAQARSAPSDLAAALKLYRDLNALYDVLGSLVESAGAFGSKDEFSTMATDVASFDDLRRSFADSLEAAAVAQQAELARLQNQVRAQAAAPPPAPPPPPQKIVIDDTQPPPKPVKRKKTPPATPKAPPATPKTPPAQPNAH